MEGVANGAICSPEMKRSRGMNRSGVNHTSTSFSHGLIDVSAVYRGSAQKECWEQESWKPVQSRPFLLHFGRSKREPYLTADSYKALYSSNLENPGSERALSPQQNVHVLLEAREGNPLSGSFGERLLLDSRVVDVPMAFNPTFVTLVSWKAFFFKDLKSA
jgi:hypothetical protein